MLLWTTRGDMTLTAGSDVTQPILCMFFCCSSLTDRAACMTMSSNMHAASGQLFLFIYIKIDLCWLIALANTVPSCGGTGLVGYCLLRGERTPCHPKCGLILCTFINRAWRTEETLSFIGCGVLIIFHVSFAIFNTVWEFKAHCSLSEEAWIFYAVLFCTSVAWSGFNATLI